MIYGGIFPWDGGGGTNDPFTGATSTTDGVQGLVPAPLAGQQGLFLRGDGTWAAAGGGGGGITWNVTTGNTNLVADNGYITNGTSEIEYTLPLTAEEGDTFKIVGKSVNGWRINQNAGQTIYLGSTTTTTGDTGYVNSTQSKDCIELVCVIADQEFVVTASVGQIELT